MCIRDRCRLLEILERGRESFDNRQIDGEIARVRHTVLAGSESVSIETRGTESGDDGAAGKASEFTERRDPEPTERCNEFFPPDSRDVERSEERRVVLDDEDWRISEGRGGGMFRSERAIGESDPETAACYPIDLLPDPFDEHPLAPVVGDGAGHRDEDQSGFHDFDLRDEILDCDNDPLECDHLSRSIALDGQDKRADTLCLTSLHPALDPRCRRCSVHRFDPAICTEGLGRLILWRSRPPERPFRIPDAECASHRPPSRSSGSFLALPSPMQQTGSSSVRSARVLPLPRSMWFRVLPA